jgi:hypothetical protein
MIGCFSGDMAVVYFHSSHQCQFLQVDQIGFILMSEYSAA